MKDDEGCNTLHLSHILLDLADKYRNPGRMFQFRRITFSGHID